LGTTKIPRKADSEGFSMEYQSNHNRVFTASNGTTSNIAIDTASGSENRNQRLLQFDVLVVEVCSTVKDEITGYRVVGKGLAKLLSHPGAGVMLRHIKM
jgi:hypothetical protein